MLANVSLEDVKSPPLETNTKARRSFTLEHPSPALLNQMVGTVIFIYLQLQNMPCNAYFKHISYIVYFIIRLYIQPTSTHIH